MKRLQVVTYGPPPILSFAECEPPAPGPGEVRIRVQAVGLGFVDSLLAAGRYQIRPPLPYVPGGEIAGVVDATGDQVRGLRAGERVATWQLGGGLAEYVVVAAQDVVALPAGLDSVTAASAILDYHTAHYALMERGDLKSGEIVLVTGAAGGVGAAAVQIAAKAGARVIAAASNPRKRAYAAVMGAHAVVDSTDPDLRVRIREAAAPAGGVDVVVDPVGGPNFEALFRSLAKEGRHLVVGFAGGPIPALPANLPLLKSAALVGVDLRQFFAGRPDAARGSRAALLDDLAGGRLRPPAIARFAFAKAPDAIMNVGARDKEAKGVVLVSDAG